MCICCISFSQNYLLAQVIFREGLRISTPRVCGLRKTHGKTMNVVRPGNARAHNIH